VVRGYLGVYLQELTNDLAEAMGVDHGVVVKQVIPGTPAEDGGLAAGDVIVTFDRTGIKSMGQLQSLVAGTEVGKRVEVGVVREERERTFRIVLGEMPDEVAGLPEEDDSDAGREWLGMRITGLGSEEARRYALEAEEGVLVVDVELGGPADEGGIRRGDVIRRIGKLDIADTGDYEVAREQYGKATKPIVFLIQRGEDTSFVAVRHED
jgi:serine protease Do